MSAIDNLIMEIKAELNAHYQAVGWLIEAQYKNIATTPRRLLMIDAFVAMAKQQGYYESLESFVLFIAEIRDKLYLNRETIDSQIVAIEIMYLRLGGDGLDARRTIMFFTANSLLDRLGLV